MGEQPDLSELIMLLKSDRSFSELARAGGVDQHGVVMITKGRVQQLAGGDISRWPSPNTVRALARALPTTDRAVILAAGRSLGFTVDESSVLENLLPPGLGLLTEADLAAIVGLVTHLVDTRRAESDRARPARAGARSQTGSEGRGKTGATRNTA
jgi:hypothetical protein